MEFRFSPHIALNVTNHKELAALLMEVLGMREITQDEKEIHLNKDGINFYLETEKEHKILLEFSTDNLELAKNTLIELGCEIKQTSIPEGNISYFITTKQGLTFHLWDNSTYLETEIQDLEEEIQIKKRELARLRCKLVPEKVKEYYFTDKNGDKVRLSSLFGNKNELILIHNMGTSCSYCTMWADGFNGLYQHLEDRAAFVLTSPDDYETQREFAESRNWKFNMVSAHDSDFIKDMGFLFEGGDMMPGVSIFTKDENDNCYRTNRAFFGPYDDFCSAWNFFLMLPSREEEWSPKFKY